MQKEYYAFERDGLPLLQLTWEKGWRNFEIFFGEKRLGEFENGVKALQKPRNFRLPDGSTLSVALNDTAAPPLIVQRNDKPMFRLPSKTDRRWARAKGSVITAAMLNIILSIAILLSGFDVLDFDIVMITMPASIIAGILMLPSAYLLYYGNYHYALHIATAIYLIETIISYQLITSAGGFPDIFAPLVRGWFLYYMALGMIAQRDLFE